MKTKRALTTSTLLLLGLTGGVLLKDGLAARASSHASAPPSWSEHDCARGLSRAFQEVARRVGPAVISVLSVQVHETERGERRSLRQGSGVILRSDGLAVTNNHVIRDSESLSVQLADGRRLEAQVLGVDPETDLAVLQIEGSDLLSAPLESVRKPQIGEWVLAMGNPHGLSHTVTAGIISARGRTDLDIATFEDFLQTDAAINPGNSGGPLIDLDGRVVGINTAIGTQASGGLGLGFAIPGHLVKMVLDGIAEEGRVRRGWLGVQLLPLTVRQAETLGLERSGLVLVERVLPGSPASRAGLEDRDVILAVEGEPVSEPQELMNRVAAMRPGSTVAIEVLREARRFTVEATLAEREPEAVSEVR